MTWENDKNETATQIYSFIADFDEKIYANEERREDSLIQTLENKPLKEIQNAPENPLLGVTTSEPLIRTIYFSISNKRRTPVWRFTPENRQCIIRRVIVESK